MAQLSEELKLCAYRCAVAPVGVKELERHRCLITTDVTKVSVRSEEAGVLLDENKVVQDHGSRMFLSCYLLMCFPIILVYIISLQEHGTGY